MFMLAVATAVDICLQLVLDCILLCFGVQDLKRKNEHCLMAAVTKWSDTVLMAFLKTNKQYIVPSDTIGPVVTVHTLSSDETKC